VKQKVTVSFSNIFSVVEVMLGKLIIGNSIYIWRRNKLEIILILEYNNSYFLRRV
jgi:hypothetical protein